MSEAVTRIVQSMHDRAAMDPDGALIDTSGYSADELAEIREVMDAMRAWNDEEARQRKASSADMGLSERDMRALRFILAAALTGRLVTPAMIADYLGVTSAAVTKMIDRLHEGDHVQRVPHPHDRRAVALEPTPHTRASARSTVGTKHARRFEAAARLTSAERQVVIRFLRDLAGAPSD